MSVKNKTFPKYVFEIEENALIKMIWRKNPKIWKYLALGKSHLVASIIVKIFEQLNDEELDKVWKSK